MSPAASKSTIRVVVASFIAGAAVMLFVGLAPVALESGLAIREAWAATVEAEAPLVEPLDVAAINAQLAQVEQSMEDSRVATDAAIERLDRLSGR